MTPSVPVLSHVRRHVRRVDAVAGQLRSLVQSLPPEDGVAVFAEVYLAVTERVGLHVGSGGFSDAHTAAALDERFAARFLLACRDLHRPEHAPACWRPLFRLRHHRGIHPVQFALAGINAHIGHDLALALVDTCRSLGCEPLDLADEFEGVGEILLALEESLREELMPGQDLLRVADPLTHLAGSWSLQRAREGAWSSARALWALREFPGLAEEFTDGLDSVVGLAGRMLLTPLR